MKHYLPLVFSLLIVGCSQLSDSSGREDSKQATSPTIKIQQPVAPAKPLMDFSYTYPKNLYTRKDAGVNNYGMEIDAGLYPIGFSNTGLFAYVERACDNGCGCCMHDIVIQDILTDKVRGRLSINPRSQSLEEMPVQNHESDWNGFINPLSKFLRSFNISQFDLKLIRDREFILGGHKYEVVPSVHKTPIEDHELNLITLRYNVKVVIDDQRSVTVSKGEASNGVSFDYKGYLASPLTNQVILIFDERSIGFEGSVDYSIIPVGVTLDPKLFGQ